MWLGVLLTSLLLILGETANAKDFSLVHEIHIVEQGGIFSKTFKEMNSFEANGILESACSALGGDCGAIRIAKGLLRQGDGEAALTGTVTKHDPTSEEWRGIFNSFDGFEVCRAALKLDETHITGESTFNTTILRGEQGGVGFYAVVPKARADGPHSINAIFIIQYVPEGEAASRSSCQPDKSHPWLCKGMHCDPLSKF
ncbi:hypothetical protein [Mesorhizobium australicum]|uniref:hypothetical protein n=1 Tax=Mesorhizobium australicum TaxID=536018 RepID=UPI00333DB850